MELDIARARREKFYFGAKLVRGAYMVQERARAESLGYKDPIHPTIADTHRSYNQAIDKMLANADITEVMVASHNQQSIMHTINAMAKAGMQPSGTYTTLHRDRAIRG